MILLLAALALVNQKPVGVKAGGLFVCYAAFAFEDNHGYLAGKSAGLVTVRVLRRGTVPQRFSQMFTDASDTTLTAGCGTPRVPQVPF